MKIKWKIIIAGWLWVLLAVGVMGQSTVPLMVDATSGVVRQPVNFWTGNASSITANGEVTTANILYVSVDGDDGTGERAKMNKPYATPAAAINDSLVGDMILIGPGKFDMGTDVLNLKSNQVLAGAGPRATILESAAIFATHGAIVCPGTNSYIANLMIKGTVPADYQAGIGSNASDDLQLGFTNATIENVEIQVDAYGVLVTRPDCTFRMYNANILSKYTGVLLESSTGGTGQFYHCNIVVKGPSSLSGITETRGVAADVSKVDLFGCLVQVEGGSTANYAVRNNSVATNRLYYSRLSSSGASAFDLWQGPTAGETWQWNCLFDYSKTSGRIRSREIVSGYIATPGNDGGSQGLLAASSITPTGGDVYVIGSGGAVTLTSTPSIAAGVEGQELTVWGTSNANTVTIQDEGTLTGSGVTMNGNSYTVGEGDCLIFKYRNGKWRMTGAVNNLPI